MAYKVIILYRLYMPSYFLGTFTEYPYLIDVGCCESTRRFVFLWLGARRPVVIFFLDERAINVVPCQ